MPHLTRRAFCTSALAASSALLAQPRTPTNIVLILCDDLGYGDLGCYGSSIRTPNLDRLAAEGARFDSYTAASPVCSPSRAALLTGRYSTRVNVPRVLFPQDKEGLALNEVTLASALKQRNYRTACIGKWHLGCTPAYLPTSRGFDRYFGIPYSNDMAPRVLMRDQQTIENPADLSTLTARYTEEAVRFIEESGSNPFFLYLAHTMPHIPLGASKRFEGRSAAGLYGDVVEEIDWSASAILETLDRRKIRDNTLVIFTSDNGPWYQGSAGRLRGRKGSTFEGGMRVPFIANMPGRIPAGLRTSVPASGIDLFPTVAELTGCQSANPLDGESLWPLVSRRGVTLARRRPVLYFNDWDLQCARLGRWKVHVARHNTDAYTPAPQQGRLNLPLPSPELYDLEADADESFDVAARHPEVVKNLLTQIDEMLTGFPEVVQAHWKTTRARQVEPVPAGAWPRSR